MSLTLRYLRSPWLLPLPAALGLVLVFAEAACSQSSRESSSPAGANATGVGVDGGIVEFEAAVDGTLSIAPANQELTLVQGQAQPLAVDYKVTLTAKSGSAMDVTDRAAFSEEGANVGQSLGAFNGAKFVVAGDRVGKTTIMARLSNLEAKTSLTVRTTRVVVGAGADASTATKFAAADATGAPAPSWVYPADGVLVPPNMNQLELHYMPGAGNQLFELAFESSVLDLKIYMTCQTLGAGCSYSPDKTVWNLIASAGRDADPVVYRMRATPSGGGAIARGGDRKISFGRENITGGIYYWNAGAGQTKRYEFGVSGQSAETFLSAANAGAAICVGCHAISRDGRFIAVGLDFPGGAYKTLTVGTRQQTFALTGGSFFSFSPDGTQLMTSGGVNISWRNTANGTPIVDPLVAQGTMPDWSANGKSLVYVKPAEAAFINSPGVSKGSLEVITMNGTPGNWGSPTVLVPYQAPANNYYPTYSPDDAWVLFNRSPSGSNSFGASDSQGGNGTSGVPDAQLWVVPAAGGAPRKLDAVSTGKDVFDSWPKWSPLNQDYRGKKLMWFTFSSKRAYGLRTADGAQSQIWMAAFDPARANGGANDPSLPAFWVPFQELESGNHIAQWVTRIERQSCGAPGTCAAGEDCIEGRCIPKIK